MSFEQISHYLQTGEYPDGATKNDKRQLRLRSKRYAIKDGKLHWLNHKRQLREVVLDEKERKKILEIYQDAKGHMGIEKKTYAISAVYYWNNIYDKTFCELFSLLGQGSLTRVNYQKCAYGPYC